MEREDVEIPVFFRYRGRVHRGVARYYANWFHIRTDQHWKGGEWQSSNVGETWLDKQAIREDQLEELKSGRSIEVEFIYGEPVTVEPGEYTPTPDTTQPLLFDETT